MEPTYYIYCRTDAEIESAISLAKVTANCEFEKINNGMLRSLNGLVIGKCHYTPACQPPPILVPTGYNMVTTNFKVPTFRLDR